MRTDMRWIARIAWIGCLSFNAKSKREQAERKKLRLMQRVPMRNDQQLIRAATEV